MPRITRSVRPFCLLALMCCLLLAGCATTRFKVVDAVTDAPLDGVQVDGFRFRPLQQVPADFAWKAIDVDPTDRDGNTTSINGLSIVQGENDFQFVFTKPGYRPAEAQVYANQTLLVSPADDAGWKSVTGQPHHFTASMPTRNFEPYTGSGRMVIRLYRDTPADAH